MKYYTLDQAVKKACKEHTAFMRETNISPYRGMYNCGRALIGLGLKIYYFVDKTTEERLIKGERQYANRTRTIQKV